MADDVLALPVRRDRLEAVPADETCRAVGIRVELLTADDSGVRPHRGIAQGHRLLVVAAGADRARTIIDRRSRPRR